jgi:chemotaxis protein MotB
LMWILGSTTEEQKNQLSEFFEDPVVFLESKQGGGESIIDFKGQGSTPQPAVIQQAKSTGKSDNVTNVSDEDLDKMLQEREQRELNHLKNKIAEAIENTKALSPFKDQIKLSITHEGLSVQVVDRDHKPMFDIGSSHLKDYAVKILEEIGKLLKDVPHRISISGHTDATPFRDPNTGFSNWELSTERANSARRTFIEAGMDEGKVGRVVGLASSVLYDEENPYSPVNRRISIVILNNETAEAIGLSPIQPADLLGP